MTDPEKRLIYDLYSLKWIRYGEEGLTNPQYANKPKGPNA